MALFLFHQGLRRNSIWSALPATVGVRVWSCALLLTAAELGISGCARVSVVAPGPTVVSATDLGSIPTNPDILGRDGGYSALFQGESVWLYGDTFLAKPNAEGFTLISDSWSHTSDLTVQGGISGFQESLDSAGAPTMILPETAAEQAFNAVHYGNNCQEQPCGAGWALWPASIVVDPATGQALVFYSLVSALPGAFNFQSVGSSVAMWQSPSQQPVRPTITPTVVSGHPDLLFNENEPAFGSASLIADGTLYVYGCGIPSSSNDQGCRLGKVVAANVQNRSAWSYFAGNGNWSAQVGDAVPAFIGDSILSVARNNYLQQYLAVFSEPFSNSVMMRTAPAPEGPWSVATLAFTAMQPASGWVYDAHAHPEYDANGGQTIYVTYSRATPAAFTSEVRLVAVVLGKSRAQPQ
ncbi:MAG: DUF4185 domain-containing protein [Terracidiphilus sp.]